MTQREEQLEEMAGVLKFCKDTPIEQCNTKKNCSHCIAEQIYNAGYRKTIEAGWQSGLKNGQYGFYCTNCGAGFTGENSEWIAKSHKFCPECGANMIGTDMIVGYESGFKDGIIKFANYLKEHSCSYDLDNYFSFSAVDIDNLDDLVKKFLDKKEYL